MIKTNSRAFTLVEIMLVVVVVGTLAAVIFASFGKAREKSRNSTRVAAIEQIDLALTVYRTINNEYPPSSGSDGSMSVLSELVDANLIDEIPDDPFGDGTSDSWTSGNMNEYYYWRADDGDIPSGCNASAKYILWYHLENEGGGNASGGCNIDSDSYVIAR